MFDAKIVGMRIRFVRRTNKLTQEDLAKKLGVKRQVIGYYETGKRVPTAKHIYQITKALGTTSDYILGIKEWGEQ